MKCHICKKNLEIVNDNIVVYSKYNDTIISCPNDHCTIFSSNDIVSEYRLMWDADFKAKQRYWIYSWSAEAQVLKYLKYNVGANPVDKTLFNGSTVVTISEYGRPHKESTLISLDYFMPLNIKDDTIEINSIVLKINKLKAFI